MDEMDEMYRTGPDFLENRCFNIILNSSQCPGYTRQTQTNQLLCSVTVIKPKPIAPYWEGFITGLSEENYSYSAIIEECKKRNFVVTEDQIISVLKKGGLLGIIQEGRERANRRPRTRRFPRAVRKVKIPISGTNPATQRTVESKLGMSLKNVNTIINKVLNMQKRHQGRAPAVETCSFSKACNVSTTNYDAMSTVTAAEVTNNIKMEKNEQSSFQHCMMPPPNGAVHPYVPQPEVHNTTTVINNEQLNESTDTTAHDAWHFSGMFTQENPHSSNEVIEL